MLELQGSYQSSKTIPSHFREEKGDPESSCDLLKAR